MGCDIHLYTEYYRSINNSEKWINNDLWKINPYYEPGNIDGEQELKLSPIWRGRDYNLFAILADVRNYDDNTPISQPKGVPKDASPEYLKAVEQYGSDGHSHSYLSLPELIEYSKNNKLIKYQGMMSQFNADLVDAGAMPNSWCGWASPELKYVHREWFGANESLEQLIQAMKKQVREIYYDDSESNYERFRIVFFFDN